MPASKIAQVRRLMANDETVGMGFNSESGLAVGMPFDFDRIIVEADPNAPGQVVFSSISLVESHEQLMQSIGLAVEAQGRYGFFSADLKAQFAESTDYNTTSTFLVAKVVVENPFKRGRSFELTPDNKDLLRAQPDVFSRAFGDSFVRGLQTGGEFYSVIRLTSVSTTTQTELAVSLQAEYEGLAAGGSFKGKFTEANSTATTRSEFSAMMFQKAGTGEEIAPTREIDEVLARVKQFPVIVEAHPTAYEVEIATYDTVPLPLPTPTEAENFAFDLRDASDRKLRYIQARNDLEFARQHPEFFADLPADDVLVSAIQTYTKLLDAVMQHGSDLSTGKMQPPRLFDPSLLNPPLVEPAPITLKRASSSSGGLVRIPDLAAVNFRTLEDMLGCLEHGGSLHACVDGTAFPGPDGEIVPLDIPMDVAEFLNMAVNGGIRVQWEPGDPLDLEPSLGPAEFAVDSQDPPAGTQVPSGSHVTVHISVTPI